MISAQDAADRLATLLAREHACMADFLEALAEFDRLKGWEELGYSNLFAFLTGQLKLSKSAAFHRLVAARLVAGFPEALQPFRDGRLCMSSAGEAAKVLRRDNVASLLPRFFHLSRREAADLVAEIQPSPSIPDRDVIRSVPPLPTLLPIPDEAGDAEGHAERDRNVAVRVAKPTGESPTAGLEAATRSPGPSVSTVSSPSVIPLTADLRRLHVTVSKRLLAKLDIARDALSHSHPGASMETVLEAALDLLIERHRARRGVGAKPRARPGARPRGAADGRITAEVKRQVWERDLGQCQWPLEGGGTCGSTLRLEFDHRVPRSLGGGSGTDNVRLLCRVHNQLSARRVLGEEVMARFVRREPAAREPAASYGAASYGAASYGAASYGTAWHGPAG